MSLKIVEVRGGLAIEDDWRLSHRHALGPAGEAFVAGLDQGELVAARCSSCARLLLPPRTFCERCFQATTFETVEEQVGTLLTYTVVQQEFAGSPPVPYAITYVRLDGVDTAFGALLDEVQFDEIGEDGLTIGDRMELVIRDQGVAMERIRSRKVQ